MTKTLLIIDPQNDFCDIPNDSLGNIPSLPVPGAHEDMMRLSKYIDLNNDSIDNIVVTLDTHNIVDIAHKLWWINEDGENPPPFTVITLEDVEKNIWSPFDKENLEYAKFYISELQKAGKYNLIIWPEHCLIGSWGHNIHQSVYVSLNEWTKRTGKNVEYIFKGLNPLTEHYSAIKAEISIDEHTKRNTELLNNLCKSDVLIIAGEAFSHCLSSTVFDIKEYFDEKDIETKITILENCSSSVLGFENESLKIKEKMIEKNIKFINT